MVMHKQEYDSKQKCTEWITNMQPDQYTWMYVYKWTYQMKQWTGYTMKHSAYMKYTSTKFIQQATRINELDEQDSSATVKQKYGRT